MEAFLGFNGVFALNKWTPLSVMIENRGRAIKGTLEVVVTSGSEYRRDVRDTTYSMDVEFPTDSKKLHTFTIYIETVIHPLVIQLKQAGKTIFSRALNLRSHHTDRGLALFVGHDLAPELLSNLPEEILPTTSRPLFLPETWGGYDGVRVIILDVSVLSRLNERQFIALNEWVKRGGFLITSGWHNYGSFLEQRTRRLLPVNIIGLKQVREIHSLEKFCGETLISRDEFLILKVHIEGAVPLVKEDDVGIILEKRSGMGKLIFLAFDVHGPPFSEWTGRDAFWGKLLSLNPPVDQKGIDFEAAPIFSSMISGIPARFPSFLFVLPFLVVYAVVVPIVFKRLEKKRHQRWTYLGVLVAIVFVFSLAAYRFFWAENTRYDPSYNSFLHLKMSDEAELARGDYFFGLYGLQPGDYRLGFGRTFYPIMPAVENEIHEGVLHTATFHDKNSEKSLLISLEGWSHRFFKTRAAIPFPIQAEAFLDKEDLVVSFENRTSHTILDSQIYFAERFIPFGDITPGKKLVKRISKAMIDDTRQFRIEDARSLAEDIVPEKATSLVESLQKDLMERVVLSIHSRYHPKQDALCVFGWIGSSLIPVSFTPPDIKGEGAALFEWGTRVGSGKISERSD